MDTFYLTSAMIAKGDQLGHFAYVEQHPSREAALKTQIEKFREQGYMVEHIVAEPLPIELMAEIAKHYAEISDPEETRL